MCNIYFKEEKFRHYLLCIGTTRLEVFDTCIKFSYDAILFLKLLQYHLSASLCTTLNLSAK